MDAQQLFKAGKLTEAIPALNAHLRDNPSDARSRTFLFELLCFAGEFDRAEKQLLIIQEESSKDSMLGALLCRAALAAERTRRAMFESKAFPNKPAVNGSAPLPLRGTLNGKPFESLSDADPRLGEKLEVFAAAEYLWISFADIASIQIETPKKLRDLVWAPAKIVAGPSLRSSELGEVLLPVLSPLSYQHPDDDVRLGRATEWCADENGDEAPFGLKNLLVDGEEFPFLEIRHLEIEPASQAHPASV
jgi:type VI secretion system protein ImpE